MTQRDRERDQLKRRITALESRVQYLYDIVPKALYALLCQAQGEELGEEGTIDRGDAGRGPRDLSSLDELIAREVKETIEKTRGNKAKAARILRVNVKTLCGYLARYEIRLPGR